MARSISDVGRQCLGVGSRLWIHDCLCGAAVFKCHGTFNTNTRSEKDANTQIIIDADRGTVEGKAEERINIARINRIG